MVLNGIYMYVCMKKPCKVDGLSVCWYYYQMVMIFTHCLGHVMIACHLELYCTVKHINGVRPDLLDNWSLNRTDAKHMCLCTCTKIPIKFCHALIPLAFWVVSRVKDWAWVGGNHWYARFHLLHMVTNSMQSLLYFGILNMVFLNQVCAHSLPKAGCGHAWFTEIAFPKVCVCIYVCLYVCLSFRTHVSKALEAKSSLYMRNEGCIEPVLNLQAGELWFKVGNTYVSVWNTGQACL